MKRLLSNKIHQYFYLKHKFIRAPKSLNIGQSGIMVKENFLDEETCSYLINKFDNIDTTEHGNKIWNDEFKSDKRIWYLDLILKHSIFESNSICKKFLDCYDGANRFGLDMMNHTTFHEKNKGSGQGWHRDSPYSNQYKIIIYLCKVTAKDGPFQYIEDSNKPRNITVFEKKNKLKAGTYRFNDSIIQNYYKNYIRTVTGPTGTAIFVNTKLIHRGSPITNGGMRWAITKYSAKKEFSKDILKYK